MAGQRSGTCTLQALCDDAVAAVGDDWDGIERYVRDRVSRLAPRERRAFFSDIAAILKFQEINDLAGRWGEA